MQHAAMLVITSKLLNKINKRSVSKKQRNKQDTNRAVQNKRDGGLAARQASIPQSDKLNISRRCQIVSS